MDELTLMRRFRAERVRQDPAARDAAWRALEDRFELTPATPAPIGAPLRRRRLMPQRHRLLSLAAVTAAAAVLAGALVLDSGPTAQPAAAQILRETAAAAASPKAPAPAPRPGPGQFLYQRFQRLELQSWIPGGAASIGVLMTVPGAFAALVPTTDERWTGPDGAGRSRLVAGTPRFLTEEERSRWEASGSRLPAPFDPQFQRKFPRAFSDPLELRRGVVDTEHSKLESFLLPDTSALPTDPKDLRLAVEDNRISVRGFNLMYPSAKRLDTDRTVAQLFSILSEGSLMTPRLRAAIFTALAELPGIELDTGATDFLGRRGYAIHAIEPKTGAGVEFIFDPDTATMLADRRFLADRIQSPYQRGLPPGFTLRETAYLSTGIVDSTRETAAEAKAGEPVASAYPDLGE